MFRRLLLLLVCVVPVSVYADEPSLSPKEVAQGWIMLFDGHSNFGWKTTGTVTFDKGKMTIGGAEESSAETTSSFGPYELKIAVDDSSTKSKYSFVDGSGTTNLEYDNQKKSDKNQVNKFLNQDHPMSKLKIVLPAGSKLVLNSVTLKPAKPKNIFNGKDLTGWKVVDQKGYKSKFTVTGEGEMRIQDGPGDIQTTDEFDNFLFQLDIKSNGKHLNSGVFFRALANKGWSGYEAQIRNEFKDNDRSKPVDFGTGGLYHRQPARKVVSSDNEYFTMTISATGNHLATWVNGYQVTDFTDTRAVNESARNGQKTKAGPISLQGHDPTTDLVFKNFRMYLLK